MRIAWIVALVFMAGSSAAFAAAPLVDQPYAIADDSRMTTNVYIDGRGPFSMVIDTGASRTSLLAHTAAQLGLAPTGTNTMPVYSLAAESTSLPYTLKELRLSNEKIEGLTVAVIADPADNLPAPDGILGIDVLERYAIVFDRERERMLFYSRADGLPERYKHWRRTGLRPQQLQDSSTRFWFVDAKYDNQKADTLLDLGTSVTIITWDLADRVVPGSTLYRKNDEQVRDALGKNMAAFRITGVSIWLNGRRWTNQDVLVADAPVFARLGLVGQPVGVIGASLLKNDTFALDFQTRSLYVAPRV